MDAVTEDLTRLRAELVAEAAGDPQRLLQLTDEELLALDPVPDEARLVETPHVSRMTDEQREWVMATALRSLVARGGVEVLNIEEADAFLRSPQTSDDERVPLDLRMAPSIALTLTLRNTADRIVLLHQTNALGESYAYLYVHGDDLVLDEHVSQGGMHTFTVLNGADAQTVFRAMIDPLGAARVDGAECVLDPAAVERGDAGPLTPIVQSAVVAGRALLLREDEGPGHGRLLTTYATQSELWVVQVDQPEDPAGMRARTVSAESLADIARSTLVGP